MDRRRAGGAVALLRRVRWGNVGRLMALLAAGLLVVGVIRGGSREPRRPAPGASSAAAPRPERPVVRPPAVGRPGGEQPAVGRPGGERPAVERPGGERPAVERPQPVQPAPERPKPRHPKRRPASKRPKPRHPKRRDRRGGERQQVREPEAPPVITSRRHRRSRHRPARHPLHRRCPRRGFPCHSRRPRASSRRIPRRDRQGWSIAHSTCGRSGNAPLPLSSGCRSAPCARGARPSSAPVRRGAAGWTPSRSSR